MRDQRSVLAGGLLAVLALVAGACSGDDSSDAGTGSGSGSTVQEEGEEQPTGGTLLIAASGVVQNLDPKFAAVPLSTDLLPNLSGTLFRFGPPETEGTLQRPEAVEAELAESWEASPDGTTVTVNLREDVLSAAGNPLDAEDVRWSVERGLDSNGQQNPRSLMTAGGWDLEEPITVVDDSTIELNIPNPNAFSLSILTLYQFTIYDKEDVTANATAADPYGYEYLADHSASFGPYTVSAFEPGVEVTLVANENYFRDPPPYDEVIVRGVAEASTRLQLVQRGEADIAMSLSYEQLDSVSDDPDVQIQPMPAPPLQHVLVFNHARAPFDDPVLREAISYAIDREALVEAAYKGFGTAPTSLLADAFAVDGDAEPIGYDPERAEELLEEGGYGDGVDIAIAYNANVIGPQVDPMMVLVRQQLADVGVNLTLTEIPVAADFDAARRDNSQMAWLIAARPLIPDSGYFLNIFFATKAVANQHAYSDPEVDRLIAEVLASPPGDERDDLVAETSDLLTEDHAWTPLVNTSTYSVFSPDVEGYVSYPQGFIGYADLAPAGT
ncbi:MAG: ABC transporter substrate-binding protein [Acidimicrobiia bacterium]